MNLQQLMSLTRQAIDDYQMIASGDHIAVGVSGGKDSLTLLLVLKGLMRFYPKTFTMEATSVDLGFGNMDFDQIANFCSNNDIPCSIAKTEIASIVFQERKEKNPCSLCSKLRKGAFNDLAKSHGCNKTAFGHHKDDAVHTMLMSMIYEGKFQTFAPVTHLDRTNLTLIRPLIYVNEADIIGFCRKNQIPVLKNACPADRGTKREYCKNLTNQINRENNGAKDRMFTAIVNGVSDYQLLS